MTKQEKIRRIGEIEQELMRLPKGKVFFEPPSACRGGGFLLQRYSLSVEDVSPFDSDYGLHRR